MLTLLLSAALAASPADPEAATAIQAQPLEADFAPAGSRRQLLNCASAEPDRYERARCLYGLGFEASAQSELIDAFRAGERVPETLAGLATVAELSGDHTWVMSVLDEVPPQAWPREHQSLYYFLVARRTFDEGRLAESFRLFQQLSARSPLYQEARFYEALRKHVHASARVALNDILQANSTSEDLRQRALLQLGRNYGDLGSVAKADSYYAQVDARSRYATQALFERVLVRYQAQDFRGALDLLTASTTEDADLLLLRALLHRHVCEEAETQQLLAEYQRVFVPVRDELRTYVERYRNHPEKPGAYDEMIGSDSAKIRSLVEKWLRNPTLEEYVDGVERIDAEVERLHAEKRGWREAVGDALAERLAEGRHRDRESAARLLVRHAAVEHDHLVDLTVINSGGALTIAPGVGPYLADGPIRPDLPYGGWDWTTGSAEAAWAARDCPAP